MYLFQHFFHRLGLVIISLFLTFFVLLGFLYLFLDRQSGDVQALKTIQLTVPLRVYTKEGQLIAQFGEQRRDPVPLDKIPPLLIKAVIATEDQRFYQNVGVDPYGLVRAAVELATTGTKTQGGSTITMQLARDFYLSRKKTFLRKLNEIILALKINRELSKDEILYLYLNKVFLGNRAYGVAAAAYTYFGKALDQLTLPEMATIAGLPKAPSALNPLANPDDSKDRRDHVLERMFEQGYINKKQYDEALATPLKASYHGERIPLHAPWVAEMVRNMMETGFGEDAYTQGFNVYTTITVPYQTYANKAYRDALVDYDHRHGYRGAEANLGDPDPSKTKSWIETLVRIPTINGLRPAAVEEVTSDSITALLGDGSVITIPWEGIVWAKPQIREGLAGGAPRSAKSVVDPGDLIRVEKDPKDPKGQWQLSQIPRVEGALVALNPNTGAIIALVGGFDFQRDKYNHAAQMTRQPGSGFKPFILSAALTRGFSLSSIFDDAPISFYIPDQGVWAPKDDDGEFWGPMTLRFGLAHSRNAVFVRVLQAVGVNYAIDYLPRFGFDPKVLPHNLSLTLGTADLSPLEMVRGYATFANGGYRITPYLIDHITDAHNELLYQSNPKNACAACITEDPPIIKRPTSDSKSNQNAPQVLSPQNAFLMTSALQSVIQIGTGKAALSLNRTDLAGKTGTTNQRVDAWFNGFNSDIVCTVWVGFDNPTPLHEYGAQAALPMWINFMGLALAGKPMHTMPMPPGITEANIDTYKAGLVPDEEPLTAKVEKKNNTNKDYNNTRETYVSDKNDQATLDDQKKSDDDLPNDNYDYGDDSNDNSNF